MVIDAYGQPHKFGEIPRCKEYESENPLCIKSKTMSTSKVHPLMKYSSFYSHFTYFNYKYLVVLRTRPTFREKLIILIIAILLRRK